VSASEFDQSDRNHEISSNRTYTGENNVLSVSMFYVDFITAKQTEQTVKLQYKHYGEQKKSFTNHALEHLKQYTNIKTAV